MNSLEKRPVGDDLDQGNGFMGGEYYCGEAKLDAPNGSLNDREKLLMTLAEFLRSNDASENNI